MTDADAAAIAAEFEFALVSVRARPAIFGVTAKSYIAGDLVTVRRRARTVQLFTTGPLAFRAQLAAIDKEPDLQ